LSLPGRGEALGILREAGCSRGVVSHCERVAEVALRIAGELAGAGFEVDLGLVEAGALLHDLGRSRTHGVGHGVAGGEIARGLGLPEAVARIVERHIGAGLPVGEAVELGLPRGCYVPETLEEKIVTYADKLIEGGREVGFGVTLGRFEEELGVGHPSLGRLRALHEEMVGLLGG
jgi:uncharacterized protein